MRNLLATLALVSFALAPTLAAAGSSTAQPVAVPSNASAPAMTPASASASASVSMAEPSLGAKFADAFLRIPAVGLSLASTGLYLGTTPLTFLMDVDQPAADTLVSMPWYLTSGRELGRFSSN